MKLIFILIACLYPAIAYTQVPAPAVSPKNTAALTRLTARQQAINDSLATVEGLAKVTYSQTRGKRQSSLYWHFEYNTIEQPHTTYVYYKRQYHYQVTNGKPFKPRK